MTARLANDPDMLSIDLWGPVSDGEAGPGHVHMCPECFEDVPCDDDCSWGGEYRTNDGRPACHPVICDRCRLIIEQYQDQGSGI